MKGSFIIKGDLTTVDLPMPIYDDVENKKNIIGKVVSVEPTDYVDYVLAHCVIDEKHAQKSIKDKFSVGMSDTLVLEPPKSISI